MLSKRGHSFVISIRHKFVQQNSCAYVLSKGNYDMNIENKISIDSKISGNLDSIIGIRTTVVLST